jgi:hypothetical protein
MKSWSTLLLAFVALALLAFFYFGGDKLPSTTDREAASRKVFTLEADKVTRVELVHAAGEFLLNKDTAGGWSIEKPIRTAADVTVVGQILSELEFAERRSTLREKDFENYSKAIESFGLKSPKATIKLLENGRALSLSLGNATARSSQIYALASDGKKEDLVIVDQSIETSVVKDLSQLRSRAIFSFQTPFVDSILVRRSDQTSEVVKKGSLWNIVQPLDSPADEGRVTGFLSSLLSARVGEFVTDASADLDRYGLSSPAAVLEIRAGSATSILRIGQAAPGQDFVYAQRAEEGSGVITLPKGLADQITGLLEGIRDRRLLTFQDPFEFVSWKITRRGQSVEGTAGSARVWNLSGFPVQEANTALVNTFLVGLRDQSGDGLTPRTPEALKKAGLETPSAVVELVGKSPESGPAPEPVVIRFGTPRKGKVTADSSRLPHLVEVPEALLSTFPVSSVDWYAPLLKLVPRGTGLSKITWKRPAGDFIVQRQDNGEWGSASEGKEVDKAALSRQTALFESLNLTAWVPLKPADFAKPRTTLVLEGSDGFVRTVDLVLFGRENEYRGIIRGGGAAFILSAQDGQILDTPPVASLPPQN